MLILLRRQGEQVILDKGKIEITVIGTKNDHILLGIKAPPEIGIDRKEIYERKQATEQAYNEYLKVIHRRKA